MGTKAAGDMCYANALPDEPMMVLLARDPEAPELTRRWARKREQDIVAGLRPMSDMAQVKEAYATADKMVRWRIENDGKWRVPLQTAIDEITAK